MSQSKFVNDLPSGELGDSDSPSIISSLLQFGKNNGPTPEEIETYMKSSAGGYYQSKYDLNNDGKIDEKDVEIARARRKKRKPKRSEPNPVNTAPATRNGNGAEMAANASQSSSSLDLWAWIKSIFGA